VLGICGGYQMLGNEISDPEGVERGGSMAGLGLLPCKTVFAAEKARTRVRGTACGGSFSGAEVEGYEIHMGRTTGTGEPFCVLEDGQPEGAVSGNVFGTYLHGLFDSGELTEKLAEWLLTRKGLKADEVRVESHREYEERQFDILAAEVRAALDMEAIYRAMAEYEEKRHEH
jgi:adenosylcobyric acid synthase